MINGNSDEIARLVEAGRVHRRVYSDPEIFDLEMERIFGRAWLFVGHTSQVPTPGDFITTELGRQPVIMTRHSDGSVHVLLNRCTHRGPKVVNERCGHAARRCRRVAAKASTARHSVSRARRALASTADSSLRAWLPRVQVSRTISVR